MTNGAKGHATKLRNIEADKQAAIAHAVAAEVSESFLVC